MAKAVYQVGDRVLVRPVGAIARVEKVIPVWAKGVPEPVRVTYDCGLGREFAPAELEPARGEEDAASPIGSGVWRVMRAQNRLRPRDAAARPAGPDQPAPGTHPVVVTGPTDWGGWRVPAAEYDLDPERAERQARLIAAAPRLKRVAQKLADYAERRGGDLPEDLRIIAQEAAIAIGAVDGFEETYRRQNAQKPGEAPPPQGGEKSPPPPPPATGSGQAGPPPKRRTR